MASLQRSEESHDTPLVVPQQRMSNRRSGNSRGPRHKDDQVDIEMIGRDAPDSLACDELKIVHLKHLTIGKDYEYQDSFGDWFPVKITEEAKDGTYVGQSLFTKKKVYNKIRPSQCIESAAPHKENWVSYWFWTIFDLCFTAGIVVGCIILHKHHPEVYKAIPSWVEYIWILLLIPLFFLARLFWFFYNRAFSKHARAVKSVKNFVSHRVAIDGKEVYFVGTMHVSPGSVTDVQRVADEVDPDVYMIELDYDRLIAMKEAENPPVRDQWLFKKNDKSVRGVHTDWNAAIEKSDVAGTLTFTNGGSLQGKILVTPLVKGNLGCFVHEAEKRGAVAVFFLDSEGTIGKTEKAARQSTHSNQSSAATQSTRMSASESKDENIYVASRKQLHGDGCCSLTQYCLKTGQNTLPDIPCYLVPEDHFSPGSDEGVRVQFQIRAGNINPPSSCRRMCCQTSCMMCTGIGIMYGLIRLAGCKVGGEFLLADRLAKERGKVLATIDMGMGRLGAALLARLKPYPSNIWYMIVAWASVPRHLLTWLFLPQGHKLDLVLNMLYGFARFHLRTWLAFGLGIGVSCGIMALILLFVQYLSGQVAETVSSAAGKSDEAADGIGGTVALIVGIGIQAYLFPVIYKGLLDSRDEQMYRGAVAQIRRRPNAKKFMIVIGAAHSNGMIRRMYERGFMPDGKAREARRNWAPFPFNKGFFFNYLYYGTGRKTAD